VVAKKVESEEEYSNDFDESSRPAFNPKLDTNY